jgi:hypothetical protein
MSAGAAAAAGAAVTLGLLMVVDGFLNDVVMTSMPAKTTSTIRVGKIFGRIFFILDAWFIYWHR